MKKQNPSCARAAALLLGALLFASAGDAESAESNLYEMRIQLGPSIQDKRHVGHVFSSRLATPIRTEITTDDGRFVSLGFTRRLGRYFRVEGELSFDSAKVKSILFQGDTAPLQADARAGAREVIRGILAVQTRFEERLADAATRDAANTEINTLLDALTYTPSPITTSASGRFLTLNSFFNLYANLPLSKTFVPYIGSGIGIAWSKFDDGLTNVNLPLQFAHPSDSDADMSANDLDFNQRNYVEQRRNNHNPSTNTSFSVNAMTGLRWKLREGPVLDFGYQWVWIEDGYSQTGTETKHLFRLGVTFVF